MATEFAQVWPPTVEDIKNDKTITDTIDDDALEVQLGAAIDFVMRTGPDYNYANDVTSLLPVVPRERILGTMRLAARWYARRSSPEAMISLGELGAGRVPSFDPDIDRMLRIGRFAPARFA